MLRGIDSRFEKPRLKKGEIALPFDEVRASVNLVLASILIAVATSMKLPLSTTYVTFMVAMGSSLADGAWDRETAVYRISGVMAVISGWFLTGFTAFILAGIAVLLCIWFGPWFMVLGGIFVIIRLFKSNFFPKKEKVIETEGIEPGMAREELRLKLNHAIAKNLDDTVSIFSTAMTNFLAEDYEELKKTRLRAQGLLDKISYMRSQYYLMFVRGEGPGKDYDARNYYYRTFSNMKDVAQDLRNTLSQMEDHLANSHSVFKGVLRSNLLQASNELTGLEHTLSKYVEAGEISDDILLRLSDTNLEEVNKFQIELMKQIEEHQMPLHRSELYLSILQLYREIVNRYTVIVLLQRELNFVLSDPDRDNGAPEYAVEHN